MQWALLVVNEHTLSALHTDLKNPPPPYRGAPVGPSGPRAKFTKFGLFPRVAIWPMAATTMWVHPPVALTTTLRDHIFELGPHN